MVGRRYARRAFCFEKPACFFETEGPAGKRKASSEQKKQDFEKKGLKKFAGSQKCTTFASQNKKRVGTVAQLNRASDYGSEGLGFESLQCHLRRRTETSGFRSFNVIRDAGVSWHLSPSNCFVRNSFQKIRPGFVCFVFLSYLCSEIRILIWRGGRVVDYSGLENRRTERYRGFESLPLRQIKKTR